MVYMPRNTSSPRPLVAGLRSGAKEGIHEGVAFLSLPSGRAQPSLLMALREVATPWRECTEGEAPYAGPPGVVWVQQVLKGWWEGTPAGSQPRAPPCRHAPCNVPARDREGGNPGGQWDQSRPPSVLRPDLPIPGRSIQVEG